MPEDRLSAAKNLFIRRWGEMAAGWGISRTMAEIHALLYMSAEPLCTDDVMAELAVSRGSASINLRELVRWGLIHRVHRRNDRKEYFDAEHDVWQMFDTILRERRRREVEPMLETLRRCLTMIHEDRSRGSAAARKNADSDERRFTEILDFCETMNSLFNLMSKAGPVGLKPLAKTVGRLVGAG